MCVMCQHWKAGVPLNISNFIDSKTKIKTRLTSPSWDMGSCDGKVLYWFNEKTSLLLNNTDMKTYQ